MRFIITGFLFVILLSSCASSKRNSINMSRESEIFYSEQSVILFAEVSFRNDSLDNHFNELVDYGLNAEIDNSVMGFEVAIEKSDTASLKLVDHKAYSSIPLFLEFSRKDRFRRIKAEAGISVQFVTDFYSDTTGHLVSKTVLEKYEWTQKPKLGLGWFNVPVKTLSDLFIKLNKDRFERLVDESIKEQFDFENRSRALYKEMSKEILIDSSQNIRLKFRPGQIKLGKFKRDSLTTSTYIRLESQALMSDDMFDFSDLVQGDPGIVLDDFQTEVSKIHIVFQADISRLDDFIRSKLAGRIFEKDGQEVQVKDISVDLAGKKQIQVKLKLEGDFNGTMEFSLKPEFNKKKQSFKASDFDLKVKSDNFFQNTGIWFIKSRIKREFSEMLNFTMTEKQEELQTQLDRYTQELTNNSGFEVKLDLESLVLDEFEIKKRMILMDFELNLRCRVNIDEIFNINRIKKVD